MPTGYTAGILDGTISNFQDFAKQCVRAFGATIHMKDEPANKEYEPRVPTDYHVNEISKAKVLLQEANELSDEQIIAKRQLEVDADREYQVRAIEKSKEDRKKLNEMLQKAKAYQPPTKEHIGIKEFMIDQIEKTIDFDCNYKYHSEKITEIDIELAVGLDAKAIRKNMIFKAQESIAYHIKNQEEEVKRCNDSNQWVEDYFNSL